MIPPQPGTRLGSTPSGCLPGPGTALARNAILAACCVLAASAAAAAKPGAPEAGAAPSVPPPAAVSPAPSAPPPEKEPPRGPSACLVLPLSGPHAALGQRVAGVLERALGAASVPVLRLDDRGDPAGVAAALARADEDRCVVLAGGLGDLESQVLEHGASSMGLPLVSLAVAGASPAPNVVRVRTPRGGPIARLAGRLAGMDGVRRAHAVLPADRFGSAAWAAFREAFEASGGRPGAVLPLPAGGGDPKDLSKGFAQQVRAARGEEGCVPEVVFLPMSADAARRWLGFLEAEGVTGRGKDGKCPPPVVAGTSLWADAAGLARDGAALEGARFADVRLEAEEAAGSVLEAEAADGARLLAAAWLKAPERDRFVLAGVLRNAVVEGGPGGSRKVEDGRLAGREVATFTIRAGRAVPDGARP